MIVQHDGINAAHLVKQRDTMTQNTQDWSFSEVSRTETLWGPHGYHRYPAKFIPQLVRRIIDIYATPGDYVGDLFVGSGTTGVEAVRGGYRFYGADINAVARLISQAKCIPLDPEITEVNWNRVNEQLRSVVSLGRCQLTEQELTTLKEIDINRASPEERLNYWFPKQHRDALSQILITLERQSDEQFRVFLRCAFSNILKRCSIWLSGSTKAQKDLTKTLADPIEEFRKHVKDMMKRNKLYWVNLIASGIDPATVSERVLVELQDTRSLKPETPKLDLLVTSPPYATCYEYSEIHQLTQLWFEKYKIVPTAAPREDWIGSRGGASCDVPSEDIQMTTPAATQALTRLEEAATIGEKSNSAIMREVRALRRYFEDMQKAIAQMASVVKSQKYMVLVIGDSRKRNVEIPTGDALTEMAISVGFELRENIDRKVPGRVLVSTRDRTSGRFSSSAASDVQVYPEESILVFQRR